MSPAKPRTSKAVGSVPAPHPPAALADFQRWFGRASTRPLLPGNKTRASGIDGPVLAREANTRLRTVSGVSGLERLEVYNRQYWFRLITILQEELPCCLHVLGLNTFNAWVIRYLVAEPPASPYLAEMDAGFPAFLRRRLRGPKRVQAVQAAEYDKAFSRALDAPDAPDISSPGAADAKVKWIRAPHVTPLWLDWDFSAYRTQCLTDESLTGRFPLRRAGKNGRGTCVHRHENILYEKPILRAEYLLLNALGKPRTLDQLFRAARRGATSRDLAALERNVAAWFRDWTELGWIGECSGDDAV